MATPLRARALKLSGRFVTGLKAHNAFEAAASIAFWFFLSFVPLLVLLGFLVGLVARSRGVDALLAPLLDVVPGTAEDIVRKELERLAGGNASLAPVGVVGYFWTASSGLHNLMDVFETAVKVTRRPWWQQRLIALGWVLMGLAAACVLAWSLVRVDGALHAHDLPASTGTPASATPVAAAPPATPSASGPSGGRAAVDHVQVRAQSVARSRGALKRRVHNALNTPIEQAIAAALMLALGVSLLAGFYRFAVVHPPGVKRRFWPGAVTAVFCWLVVSWVFGEYVASMSSYALYYGSLAAVAVMLIWLYLTSLSLVLGAEVNAQLEGVRD